jgi:hypothetical protein
MEIKRLDKEALEYLVEQRSQGAKLTQMTEDMNDLGYTQASGNKLKNADVSTFLCTNGHRAYNTRKKAQPNFSQKKVGEIMSSAFEAGKTRKQVAKLLNQAGLTTRRGKKWNYKSVVNYQCRNHLPKVPSQLSLTEVVAPVVKTTTDDIFTEIRTSNLSKNTKLLLLEQYL